MGDRHRLTSVQRELWTLAEMAPDDVSYHVHLGLRITGELDIRRLEGALTALVGRHAALRTRFTVDNDDEPVAIVRPPGETELRLNVSPVDGSWDAAEKDAVRPLDLESGPPLRASLFTAPGREHLLLLTLHHISVDWWSVRILAAELGALYDGIALPDPVGYPDYTRYQHELFGDSQWAERNTRHWRERLAGAPEAPLPLDRPPPRVREHRGGHVPIEMAAETVAELTRAGRESHASLYMTLLAVFGWTLAEWSGHPDLIVGMPFAGRHRPGDQAVVGVFARILPIRLAVDPAAFGTTLTTTRDRVLDALGHPELPPQLGTLPIPATVQLLQSPGAGPSPGWAGLTVTEWELPHRGRHRFDLEVHLTEQADGGLTGAATYGTDVFDRATIDRVMARFGDLVHPVAGRGRP